MVNVAQEEGAVALVKGLRAVSDFDYELQMAHMNEQLSPDVVTIAVLASSEFTFLSSTLVRDVARLGRDVSPWVPRVVATRMRERFQPAAGGTTLPPAVPDAERRRRPDGRLRRTRRAGALSARLSERKLSEP